VACLSVGLGLAAHGLNLWPQLENSTLDARFALRGTQPAPSDVVIVAIDDRTFSALNQRWPFPRRRHAELIDRLKADGARAIAYDVQFTEPTDARDDMALFDAVRRAGNVVLATTEVNRSGQTDVLGGPANLRAARTVAAGANLPADGGGTVRRYSLTMLGLPSFAAAVARDAGRPVPASRFDHGSAYIDFRGPPGTIRTVSFSSVLHGRVPASVFAGRVVVVGATSPTLQDLHATSTTSAQPMAGAEVQANAIWTALHGNPLDGAGAWSGVLAIVLGALCAPLLSARLRLVHSSLISVALAAGYLGAAQLLFDHGAVLLVSYPLAAWLLGTVGTTLAHFAITVRERRAFAVQLRDSQVELIQRLAQAVESRDAETGEHIYRIGLLSQRLALEAGWSAPRAEMLKYASVAHDVGKIGIPDSILLKAGPLDPEEWAQMKSHTTIGAEILGGSPNPLLQMAETVALSHHERWDGSGYPHGLAGEEIPIEGRICALVDVYDALLSPRSYKGAWSLDEVLAEITRGSGTHFDPDLVLAFLRIVPRLDGELRESVTRERSALGWEIVHAPA
jgi:HD-GYP domain-containing protein (c-di-GMP phosphodiesterase class II)